MKRHIKSHPNTGNAIQYPYIFHNDSNTGMFISNNTNMIFGSTMRPLKLIEKYAIRPPTRIMLMRVELITENGWSLYPVSSHPEVNKLRYWFYECIDRTEMLPDNFYWSDSSRCFCFKGSNGVIYKINNLDFPDDANKWWQLVKDGVGFLEAWNMVEL